MPKYDVGVGRVLHRDDEGGCLGRAAVQFRPALAVVMYDPALHADGCHIVRPEAEYPYQQRNCGDIHCGPSVAVEVVSFALTLRAAHDEHIVRRTAPDRRQGADIGFLESMAPDSIERTVIRAPFAGRVLKRHLEIGATLSHGTDAFDLADLDPLEADVNVPEPQVARMAAGQVVRITTDAKGAQAEAVIERIAPSVNPDTGTVKVTLAVDAAEGLRPGSFVRVSVVTETHVDATVVPRAALVAEGRHWHLFAVAPDGETVQRIAVSPGLEEDGLVEILGPEGGASPIEPGREVVVLGAPALSDGARVRIAGAKTDPVADESEDASGERS